MKKVKTLIDRAMDIEISVLTWAGSFLGIIGIRILVERLVIPAKDPATRILVDYFHNVFFFGIAYLVMWLFLSKIMQVQPKKLAFLFLCTAWLIVLPPIFDIIKTGGGVYWSFYLLDNFSGILANFSTFFGKMASGIVYFGTKIVFATTILLVFGLVYIKTEKIIKATIGAFMAYLTLFIMGTFPSWLVYATYFFQDGRFPNKVQGFQIAQFFGSPKAIFGINFFDLRYFFPYSLNLIYFAIMMVLLGVFFLISEKKKMLILAKNARLPQLIYHSGLLCVGLGLGFLAYPSNFNLNIFSFFALFNLLLSIWLAWIASVIINDVADFSIDKISNPQRPLQQNVFSEKEYLQIGIFLFGLSLLGGLVVDAKFALLLFFYQFIAWAYSAPPFRIKKIPILATFFSALASLIILFIGFLMFSGEQNIDGLSWRIILLLLISLTLSLPVKDFKDINGDQKNEIWTIPVIFGEKNGRIIVAVGVFISFMLSVFFLNEFHLFWWAILFGSGAFWVVLTKKPRQLFWWVGGTVFLYLVVMIKILFIN